ncbi:MAG: SRPBCC domain-containing protein, partial [Abditibacteriaceae bacterium]
MNTTEISAVVNPGEPGITYQRILNAPRELVFEVWTQPQHVAKWWGPNGFTNTILKMDVRSGGVWEAIMHGPDGTDYKGTTIYDEVTPPERLVYTHTSGPWFKATITFEEYGDQTRLTM